MQVFHCNKAGEGYFVGPVQVIRKIDCEAAKAAIDPTEELNKFNNAVDALKADLDATSLSGAGQDIIEMTALMLDDEAFVGKIRNAISVELCDAVTAARKISDEVAAVIEALPDKYMKQRADDIRGVGTKLIQKMTGAAEIELHRKSVIVAESLSPAELASIDNEYIGAIITSKGSANSHLAIIADERKIPYLFGSADAVEEIENSNEELTVLANAKTGCIVINPDEEALKEAEITDSEDGRVVLPDGVKLYANVGSFRDVDALRETKAEGVGLFRSENFFMNNENAPDEEEQFEVYKSIAEVMGEKEVVIRTLDIGSDKMPKWLELPTEKNPALGYRGIRVSLELVDIFEVQIRAILRAAYYGNLKIMLPMIASHDELKQARSIIDKVAKQLSDEGINHKLVDVGIMIEIPAAAIIADDLARCVDFFSIGTNDLSQYTLAVDRESDYMNREGNLYHEAIFKLIEMTVEAGHRAGIPVAVCGQWAADPKTVQHLTEMGIDELSVPITKLDIFTYNLH